MVIFLKDKNYKLKFLLIRLDNTNSFGHHQYSYHPSAY